MRRQGASGALAAARAVARSITCDPVGATAAFTRTAAVRSVGGSDAQSSSQSATTRFVRQSPAVCGAGAASVRGIQMPGGLGLGFGATHCRAGSTGSPLGLGDYARGARGFRATAPSRKEKDLYKLLNVPKDASASDIKKAYFKLVRVPPRAVTAFAPWGFVGFDHRPGVLLFCCPPNPLCNQSAKGENVGSSSHSNGTARHSFLGFWNSLLSIGPRPFR
jgi:hypothetical protein